MDNKLSKAELAEWKKLWTSELGKFALARIEKLKGICLELALQPTDPNVANFYVGRAGGVELVLQDIQQGILAAETEEKKTAEGGKKK